MCGLAGFVDSRQDGNVPALAAMNEAICHRGPDGEGFFHTDTKDGRHHVGLAHRRLAILDLATGDQPMFSADGQLALVFNGEIYNFVALRQELEALGEIFVTTSDTEVILHAYRVWGDACVTHFRGMFAFALWDETRQRLLLARDHFGKKPLFIHTDGARLLFASEIKAILAHPSFQPRLDEDSLADYLQYRYVPAPYTFYQEIGKLDAGHYAVWENGALTYKAFYRPPDGAVPPPSSAGKAEDLRRFGALIEECVALRMISDVPFGAFLSGGLDSSAIVALMTRVGGQPVNTFSMGFKEDAFSELGYARRVAEHFGSHHHELLIESADIMTLLPKMIAYRDAPIAEPTDIAVYLLSLEAAKSVKMVLTGEGADEMLGGYPKHRAERYVSRYQALVPQSLHERFVTPLAALLPAKFSRAQTLIDAFGLRDPKERLPRWFASLDARGVAEFRAHERPRRAVSERPFSEDQPSALRRILYFDQTSWLPDNLLERGDRMTMAASIEARMPFMDIRLAEFASAHADANRIRAGKGKWILREAMRDILPAETLTRRKVGFRIPVSEWFRHSMRDYVHDHLLGADARTAAYLNRAAVERTLRQHVDGSRNHEKLIWQLLNLELFLRHSRLA